MPKKAPEIQEKTPAEVAPFDFEFAEDLVTGETITGMTITAPAGITAGTPTASGTRVQVSLSGGTARNTYEIQCQITTSNANTYDGFGDLWVDAGSR